MSYVEALHYEMDFWRVFNETRRRTSFAEVPNLVLKRAGGPAEDGA